MTIPLRGLTIDQLRKIYAERSGSRGIERWGELVFPPFPDDAIDLYGRNDLSGTRLVFKRIVLPDADFRSSVKEEPDSSSVVAAVGGDEAGLGYSGMGYRNSEVRAIAIARRDDDQYYSYFVPRYKDSSDLSRRFKNVYNGDYPLSRLLYVYVNKPSGETLPANVEAFIKIALSKSGQQTVLEDGFIPLPLEVVERELAKLAPGYAPRWYEDRW